MKMLLRKKKTEKRRFFTLVELIAAVAVMGFVALIIGTASLSFYNTWRTAVKQTDMLRDYQKIDVVMDTLVRNMIPFNWTDEDNDTSTDLLFDGASDELFFTALRRNYGKDAGALIFVRLFVEDGKLIAAYSFYPRFPWAEKDDSTMPWTREVLTEGVQSVTFLYADRTTETAVEWLDEWDREEKQVVPLAVRMSLVWEDGREESWLRRTSGSGASSVFRDRMEVSENASATVN